MGGDAYNIYEKDILVNTIQLDKQSFGKTYINPEPRVTANYRVTDQTSIKVGYAMKCSAPAPT